MEVQDFAKTLKSKLDTMGLAVYIEQSGDHLNITLNNRLQLKMLVSAIKEPPIDCDMLLDICGVDHLERQKAKRFEVVYHFLSMKHNARVRLKVPLGEEEEIESVHDIFLSANWYERETFDMYGINFNNHPNLKRILLPEDFRGHPLRKDFPSTGRG